MASFPEIVLTVWRVWRPVYSLGPSPGRPLPLSADGYAATAMCLCNIDVHQLFQSTQQQQLQQQQLWRHRWYGPQHCL